MNAGLRPAPSPLLGGQAVGYALQTLGVADPRFNSVEPGRGSLLAHLRAVFRGDYDRAVLELISQTAISFDARTYATIPILRPYAIRDRSKRGGGTRAELWGVPREDGYFCDDNSMLKRLTHALDIASPDPRFDGRRIMGGWTACHAWRALENGRQASSYGVLNSFVAVLIWVPTALSTPTDVEGSAAQRLLKGFTRSFFALPASPTVTPYIARCWQLLGEPPDSGYEPTAHHFSYRDDLPNRRVRSMRDVARALNDVSIAGGKVLSSRYTHGLANIDAGSARILSRALFAYADCVESAMGLPNMFTYTPFPE